MGLFNLGGLFGSKGGYSGSYKRQGNDLYNRYEQAILGAFGPQAYQSRVADYTEGLDSTLNSQGAAGYGNLLSRGFSPTGGPDLYGLTRATNLARFKANTRQNMRTGYMAALQSLFGMHEGLGPENYRQGSPGILGGLAQAAGSYLGATTGVPAGGGYNAAVQSVPPSTFTPSFSAAPGLPWWEQY